VIAAAALSSLTLAESDVRAVPLTVRLEYAAGPGCPDTTDFKAVVVARLGYDPFVAGAPERVLVRIEPGDRAVDGRIEWRDASGNWAGEQAFPSVNTDCPRLARAMAFALAVQIQLLARAAATPDANAGARAESAPPPERAGDASAGRQAAATELPVVASAPMGTSSRDTGPRPVFAIGAGPSVGFGMSSGPALLGRVFGRLAWPHVSLELGAIASLPATTRRPDGAGFSQQLLLASGAACGTSTRWTGCALVNGGAVRMAGENIDRPTSATVLVVQAGARAGIAQHLGRRAVVGAHADGLVNLTRWSGRLDQVPVWTAPPFAATLGVDVGVAFP